MLMQMVPMWILAGLGAGRLAENIANRGGRELLVDLLLGLIGSVLGGWFVMSTVRAEAGMLVMFLVGFVAAAGVIGVQRLC